MDNFSDSFKIVVASLFHDVGKVRQRSGKIIKNRDNEQYIVDNQYFHAAHTAESIDDADLPDIFPFLKDLASSHHKKELSGFESILQKADHLASSLDRDDRNKKSIGADIDLKDENKNIYKKQSNYKLCRLNPIFSQINLSDVGAKTYNKTKQPTLIYDVDILNYKTKPYIIDDNLKDYEKQEAEKHYLSLYERYINDLKKIIFVGSNFNERNYITSLMYLNEKYFSLVPASCFNTSPESSLADHSIAVAAIANALLNQRKLKSDEQGGDGNHNNYISSDSSNEEKNNFCLIQGDFSGIQDFIFSLKGDSNKYVAKILRARSLFVSTATENIAHRLCKKLDLMPSSIVLNAGGKFVILSQNFSGLDNIIDEFKQSIKKEMEQLTFGKTKFIIATYCFGEEYFKLGQFSSVYKGLSLKFEEAKLRYIHDRYVYEDYINSISKAGNEVCDICGEHPADAQNYVKEEDLHICNICKKFKDNGEKIPKTNLIELNINSDPDKNNNINWLLQSIKLTNNDSLRNKNINNLNNSLSVGLKNNDDIYFDITDYDDEFMGIAKKRIVNYIPVFNKEDIDDIRYKKIEDQYKDKLDKIDEGSVKTFYHIAASALNITNKNYKNADEDRNIKNSGEQIISGKEFLGVLKADIDNMGQIFINGFKKCLNKETNQNFDADDSAENKKNDMINFPKVISLSRMIDYFFTFKIQKLIKDKYQNVYTVFSGGDDLFLIGNYKEIVELWREINKTFIEFIGGNDYIHVSYSIFLIKPDVPFIKIADIAEEELTAAKKLDGKNAVRIFQTTMRNDELKEILGKYDGYKSIYDATSVQYIYKILMFIEMEKNLKNKKSILENAKWKALLRYHTARKIEENKKINESEKNSMKGIGYDIEKFSDKLKVLLSLIIYENRK
ncbi:MAG: type III-A CRISPR-associated protein Cas10/Csm1 [Candidatus Acididesulfobacter guangdongensis]|uniref:CRISPR system single-strand-specific deoxyribonuclease Cas10/Csm1 (subtype III-A) n=1 Tax=Acididesulfobacter guangdongensis TaxID=2597225 RepID=A0A519BIU0_ACIG2|nr:MAG: type III-A CRISPR-associated protein Cas10/Csm1 [Candidatus Acididesulfobacter guangdongensis]